MHLNNYTGNEHGLIGIALDPDFDRNGHIYLYYAPAGNYTANFLSRFEHKETPNGTPYVDANSEEVMFEVYSDRATCCHQAGAIRFGPDGKIYLSTGDNTNPFESSGFASIYRAVTPESQDQTNG